MLFPTAPPTVRSDVAATIFSYRSFSTPGKASSLGLKHRIPWQLVVQPGLEGARSPVLSSFGRSKAGNSFPLRHDISLLSGSGFRPFYAVLLQHQLRRRALMNTSCRACSGPPPGSRPQSCSGGSLRAAGPNPGKQRAQWRSSAGVATTTSGTSTSSPS